MKKRALSLALALTLCLGLVPAAYASGGTAYASTQTILVDGTSVVFQAYALKDANGNDIRGLAELIVAKHRSGAVGDVKLRFVNRFARFENWDEGYQIMQETFRSVEEERSKGAGNGTGNRVESGIDFSDSGFNFSQPPASGSPMPDIMPGPGDSEVPF